MSRFNMYCVAAITALCTYFLDCEQEPPKNDPVIYMTFDPCRANCEARRPEYSSVLEQELGQNSQVSDLKKKELIDITVEACMDDCTYHNDMMERSIDQNHPYKPL